MHVWAENRKAGEDKEDGGEPPEIRGEEPVGGRADGTGRYGQADAAPRCSGAGGGGQLAEDAANRKR